ncbi:MAG: Gfo/Idh/MocA family oxidoreductase [Variibacter sp.]|nr:Gfo/Idh/MocA family oxidoreductase [Variibacter sp.]
MIRIGIIGLGWWGKQIVTCLRASPRFKVVAGYDVNPGPLAGFAAENGFELAPRFEALLVRADVDAVAIATPHTQHEAQVLAALAAGKQVFCEKPLALTGASAQRMLDAAAAQGRTLGIGHERRYEPAMEEVARLAASGALGRIMHIDANVSHDLFRAMDQTNWRLSRENAPAGAMTALGIHLTDLCIALAGAPARVLARTARHVFAPPADDFVAVDIGFANGVSARVTCLSATKFYGRFTVYGDQGWVEVQEAANVDQGKPSTLVHASATGRAAQEFAATNTVLRNFEAWADAIEARAPYRFTPAQLLANVRVLEAVVRSAEADGAAQSLA